MLFTAKLQTAEEIRNLYNIRLLGEITVSTNKKHFLAIVIEITAVTTVSTSVGIAINSLKTFSSIGRSTSLITFCFSSPLVIYSKI